MLPTKNGSFRLFRFAGIDVYLHWSWFLIAIWQINSRSDIYSSVAWNIAEYLTLFLIVLMHEYGHALACRSVGGQADQIILWPLGGVAYVAPPPRPGPVLWSIAAGPLVNVMLFPIFLSLLFVSGWLGWEERFSNVYHFLHSIWIMNTVLLVFNLLPVYPLDGGQILRSLLWFPFGPARSLMISSIIGLCGVVVMLGVAFLLSLPLMWYILLGFVVLHCSGALMRARMMSKMDRAPRRTGFACPSCGKPPRIGDFWMCGKCRKPLDTFASAAMCPNCGSQFPTTACLECGNSAPMEQWYSAQP